MNKVKIRFVLLLILLAGLFVSCREDVDFAPSLLTEEVLYLSGERVRLLGRVITNQVVEASDHGFHVSTSEQFSQPIVISLGERSGPGRFIGESDGLEAGTRYYVRTFLKTSSGEIFGNTITLESLLPGVNTMAPNNGRAGIVVTITGRNLGNDVEVYFGPNKAQVLGIDFETRIRVQVPQATSSAVVPVRVLSQGREMTLGSPFEYTTGKYSIVGNFPFDFRLYDNVSIQDGKDFYVGMGIFALGLSQTLTNRFWKYDLDVKTWSEVPFGGDGLFRAFSTGRYFGGGLGNFTIHPSNASLNFWKIENGNFVKLRDLPSSAYLSASFETPDAVYVMGNGFGTGREILRYDKATDSWTQKMDAPIAINIHTMNFAYQGKQYFVDQASKLVFAYDPVDENWVQVTSYPGNLTKDRGFGLTIDNIAYMGLENRSEQVWELNMQTLNWGLKNDFQGMTQARNVGVFQDSGKIYILRNNEIQVSGVMQLWLFEPKGF